MKKVRFLGLDVHAETIAVAIAEPDGEVRSLGIIPNREESIRKLVKKLGPVEQLQGSGSVAQNRGSPVEPPISAVIASLALAGCPTPAYLMSSNIFMACRSFELSRSGPPSPHRSQFPQVKY
jgi:hypothetical protein